METLKVLSVVENTRPCSSLSNLHHAVGAGGRWDVSPRLTRMETGLSNDCMLESNTEFTEGLHHV